MKNCATLPAPTDVHAMSEPLPSSPSKPEKAGPRLPSIRASGALAAVLFAAGIALGAAIGPAPQSSLAGPLPTRTLLSAVLPAVLAAQNSAHVGATAPSTPPQKAAPSASALSSAPTSTPVSLSATSVPHVPTSTPASTPPSTTTSISTPSLTVTATSPHRAIPKPTKTKETPLRKPHSPLRRSARKLVRVTPVVTMLMLPATVPSQAAETNPNNYQCTGHIAAGKPEEGSSEQQVAYTIACSGPISGYAIQTGAVQSTGFESAPLVNNEKGEAITTASFSCNGEIPGFGFDCVGNTTAAFQIVTGQFAIGSPLCAVPRVDPKLIVTYAYLNEKKVITQAISGPFDLGRPHGCPAAAKTSAKKGKHAGHGKGKSADGKKGKKKN